MTYPRSAVAVGEVRALLGRNRETISELAAATGISLSTLNRRLLHQAPFTLDELAVIAVHFGVSLPTLVTAPEERAS